MERGVSCLRHFMSHLRQIEDSQRHKHRDDRKPLKLDNEKSNSQRVRLLPEGSDRISIQVRTKFVTGPFLSITPTDKLQPHRERNRNNQSNHQQKEGNRAGIPITAASLIEEDFPVRKAPSSVAILTRI